MGFQLLTAGYTLWQRERCVILHSGVLGIAQSIERGRDEAQRDTVACELTPYPKKSILIPTLRANVTEPILDGA